MVICLKCCILSSPGVFYIKKKKKNQKKTTEVKYLHFYHWIDELCKYYQHQSQQECNSIWYEYFFRYRVIFITFYLKKNLYLSRGTTDHSCLLICWIAPLTHSLHPSCNHYMCMYDASVCFSPLSVLLSCSSLLLSPSLPTNLQQEGLPTWACCCLTFLP